MYCSFHHYAGKEFCTRAIVAHDELAGMTVTDVAGGPEKAGPFTCIRSAGRSQMAEGIVDRLLPGRRVAASAIRDEIITWIRDTSQ
jgi:hypothetical protein